MKVINTVAIAVVMWLFLVVVLVILQLPSYSVAAAPKQQEVLICNYLSREAFIVYNWTEFVDTIYDHDRELVFRTQYCAGWIPID